MSESTVTTWIVEQVNDKTGEVTKNTFKSYFEAQGVYCNLTENKESDTRVSIIKEEKQLLRD